MALSTFAELKAAISGILGRDPDNAVYQLTTAEINRDLRLLSMEATTTIAEAASVSLPSGFLKPVSVHRDTDNRTALTATSSHAINAEYAESGSPTKYAVADDSGTLVLKLNRPGDGTNLVIRYIAELADLSNDDDTNDVLSQHPNVYFYGALHHHGLLIGDPRGAGWSQAYSDAVASAKRSDRSNRTSVNASPTAPGMTP